jgi:peptide deformylase
VISNNPPAALKILPDDHDALSTPCDKYVSLTDINDSDFNSVVTEMLILMIESEGVGLAANQVGLFKRFFVMSIGNGGYDPIYNPDWKPLRDSKLRNVEEGCLSLSGGTVCRQVLRWDKIEATWLNASGETETRILSGIDSQCFQHETDHLNGIPFTEMPGKHPSPVIRSM